MHDILDLPILSQLGQSSEEILLGREMRLAGDQVMLGIIQAVRREGLHLLTLRDLRPSYINKKLLRRPSGKMVRTLKSLTSKTNEH